MAAVRHVAFLRSRFLNCGWNHFVVYRYGDFSICQPHRHTTDLVPQRTSGSFCMIGGSSCCVGLRCDGHPWRNAGRRQSTSLITCNLLRGFLDTHTNWHTTFPAHLRTTSSSLSSHERLLIVTCGHHMWWLHHLWMPSEHGLEDRHRLWLFTSSTQLCLCWLLCSQLLASTLSTLAPELLARPFSSLNCLTLISTVC